MNTDEFFEEAKRLNLRMLGTPEEARAALDLKDAEIANLGEQLACVRQALPEEWRNSVPSVAVASMTAELQLARAGADYDAATLIAAVPDIGDKVAREMAIARLAHASGSAKERAKWRARHDDVLLPLEARDHPEPHTMLWSETEMRAIRDYAARCVAGVLAGNGETFVCPCSGCPTPGRCKDTSGCADAYTARPHRSPR